LKENYNLVILIVRSIQTNDTNILVCYCGGNFLCTVYTLQLNVI